MNRSFDPKKLCYDHFLANENYKMNPSCCINMRDSIYDRLYAEAGNNTAGLIRANDNKRHTTSIHT